MAGTPVNDVSTNQPSKGAGRLGSDQACSFNSSRILKAEALNRCHGRITCTLVTFIHKPPGDADSDSETLTSVPAPHLTRSYDATEPASFTADTVNINICHNIPNVSPDTSLVTLSSVAPSGDQSIASKIDVTCGAMSAAVTAPGSPPGLSGSRSSKSSSSCSASQFSSPEGILSDVSNFEDIGLDDEKQAVDSSPSPAVGIDATQQRPSPHTAQSSPNVRQTPPSQNVTAARRPAYPSFKGSGRTVEHHTTRSLVILSRENIDVRRGFTSPSVPALPLHMVESHPRTRSSSPVRRIVTSAGSALFHPGLQQSPASPRASLPLPSRRGSWQPNRKSIQELEAEYHDSDDDLPDDTSLWNVPMSPRPPEDRISPFSSQRGSPDRGRGSRSPRPIPLSHAKTAPDSPPHKVNLSQSLPRHRPLPSRSSSLQATNFTSSNPPSPRSRTSLRTSRTKSWTMAMEELSEEAKVLQEALEHHADIEGRQHEDSIQNGTKAKRPSLENLSNRSSRLSAIVLPPIQKGSLDFMPISKEKEAILSRTRPSWLPPKDPKEEKKHLRQYQRMIVASIEAEKRKEDRLHVQRCHKDDTREALSTIWDEYVSPQREAQDSDDSIKDLWWRGVSPRVRGRVWERGIGNQLALTSGSYDRAFQRARSIKSRRPQTLTDREKAMLSWFRDIERDAETAFPELSLFQRHGPLWQDLVNVCEAYACYRSDVGYLYGVQLISAMLLLQCHTPSAVFILLANCLNRPVTLAFLTNDLGSTSRTYGLTISTLAIKFPRLHAYLFGPEESGGLHMQGEAIFEPMFRTLFSNGLDVDRLSRVWDCWVFEGDRTLVRSAVAVLGCLQSQIFDIDGPTDLKRRNIQELLGWGPYGRRGGYWDLSPTGDEDHFMEEVREAGKLDYTGR